MVTTDIRAADSGGFAPENVSKHAEGDSMSANGGSQNGGDGDDTCRICHQTGHYARECPDKPEFSGACYNCGEEGMSPPTSPHSIPQLTISAGHSKAECTEPITVTCKACKGEGHAMEECEANRTHLMFLNEGILELDADVAWDMMVQADKDKDLDAFKEAFKAYAMAVKELTFEDCEKAFRESEMKTFLIAKQQEVSDTHTIVNLQGEPGQEFVISFQFGAKPRRAKFAEGWPESPEENIERLSKCGFVMDGFVQKCRNCNQVGEYHQPAASTQVQTDTIQVT